MNNIALGFSLWTAVGSWMITSFIAGFPWVSLFIFTRVVGIRQYTIRDLETVKRIQRRLTCSSGGDEKDRHMGWSAGYWFFLHLNIDTEQREEKMTIWLVGTTESYLRLTEQATINVSSSSASAEKTEVEKKPIKILQRIGSFYSLYFSRRSLTIGYKPSVSQTAVIDRIVATFQKSGNCVGFLHGPPGTGKSMVGLLLADKLNATFCNNLRPWQPGDTLAALHNEADPTKENPLIVVIDEIDSALLAIHAGIEPHKNIPIPVCDKPSWNNFLDEINNGIYPWTVLLLTANRGPDFIRSLDPSYIRPGRVGVIEELTDLQIASS